MPRLPFIALLALAACSQQQDAPAPKAVASASADGATASATASSSSEGKSVEEETDLYMFEYHYPAAAAAIPGLAAWLEQDRDKARTELEGEAKEDFDGRKVDDIPFHKHSFEETWEVVTDIPGWLSLSGNFSTFSGGAHGMYGLEGYVWDKTNKRGFKSEELFQSADYLGAMMDNRVCEALNKERAQRRGQPVNPQSDDIFDQCPDLGEATILVGSSNKRTFDRITVWFGPYVAGPYAEGAFELDFPVTERMLEAVKPAYRKAFSAKG